MSRRDRRRNRALERKGLCTRMPRKAGSHHQILPVRRVPSSRKALLLGTAIVSAVALGTVTAPGSAAAQTACTQPVSPGPIIDLNVDDALVCVNTEARTNAAGDAISLSTTSDDGHYIDLYSNGPLSASGTDGGPTHGIYTEADGGNGSFVKIENLGDIDVFDTGGENGNGIRAGVRGEATNGSNTGVHIDNSGEIDVDADRNAQGIGAFSNTTSDASDNSIPA